tara:strand:+ start:306 stop:485 length:180 start_codon:yes stop_codon:yes gene_type:complete
MKISQEVHELASKQNQIAEGCIASEKLGADTVAEEGVREMAKVYKNKGDRLYLPESEVK